MRKVTINGLSLAVVAGCSCGNWVDVAQMSGARCKDLEDMKKPANKDALASFARQPAQCLERRGPATAAARTTPFKSMQIVWFRRAEPRSHCGPSAL